jgi:hypothetical protein
MVIIDISAEFNLCGEHDGCHWLEVRIRVRIIGCRSLV